MTVADKSLSVSDKSANICENLVSDRPIPPDFHLSVPRLTTIAFLLTPDYALMSLAAAVEPLRAANHLAGRYLYRCLLYSTTGGYLASTSGGGFETLPLAEVGNPDLALVVAGGNPMLYEDPPLTRALRGLVQRRVKLGGISGGAAILARAGLMAGRRFTVHWAHIDALAEHAPDLLIAAALYAMTNLGLMPGGGDALGLSGPAFWIAIVAHLILGTLMAFGVGLYAPSLILLSLLGLNPIAAFPIMMGACGFLMPVTSLSFIRSERIDLRVVIGLALGGIPAVLLAAFVVKSLDVATLRWGVVVVVLYAAAALLWSAARPRPVTAT